MPVCPKCSSSSISIVVLPKMGRAATAFGRAMVRCGECGERFSLSYAELAVVSARSRATTGPIARDLPCRSCGCNLRGLAADARCPECGGRIIRLPVVEYRRESDVGSFWRWAPVALLAALLGLGVLWGFVPRTRHPGLFLVLCAIGAAGYGTKGLATGRIRPRPTWLGEEVTGTRAKVYAIGYLILALVLLAAAMAMFVLV